MADVKWIKLATNLFDNRKIRQIECLPEGYAIIVVWVKLLCLAGNINDSGFVYFTREIPYTDQMLAQQFNIPLTTVQLALKVFEQFAMIDIVDNILHISNWEKYQNIEGLDKIREQNRLRKAAQRERQKALPAQVSRDSHVTVTQCHATEEDKEEDKDIDKEILSKESIKKPRTPKDKYGEFQRVLLTAAEHEKLVKDYGQERTEEAIAFLDAYIEDKGYKSRSHNLAIRRWVMDALNERKAKRKEPTPKWLKPGTDVQPSSERIKKSGEWLDDFLEEEKKTELAERAERLKESLRG